MSGFGDVERNIGSADAQVGGEAGWVVVGHDGIMGAVGEEHAFADERAGCGGLVEHHHGAEQDGGGERFRTKLQQGRGDVGAVGKPDGDEMRRVEAVVPAGVGDETSQCVGAGANIVEVEDAF